MAGTQSYGYIPSLSSHFTNHAMALLQRRHNYPPNSQLDAACTRLDGNLKIEEVRRIRHEVRETFPDCFINWIDKVNVPEMYGMYLLRKEEMQLDNGGVNGVEEKMLYHVTASSSALNSLNSGLDWRRTQRCRYGRGVSFGDDIEYADYHANNSTGEGNRVIMMCSVLVAKTYEVNHKLNEGNNLIVPPGMADTTVSRDGCVYVKYNDFDFYPLYLVHYQSNDSEDDDYESDDSDDFENHSNKNGCKSYQYRVGNVFFNIYP